MKEMRLAVVGRKWTFFFHSIYPAKGIRKLEFSGKMPFDFHLHGLVLNPRLHTKYNDLVRVLTGGSKKRLPNKPILSFFIGNKKLFDTPLCSVSCDHKYGSLMAESELIKAGTKIKGVIEYPRRKAPLPSGEDNKMTLYLMGTDDKVKSKKMKKLKAKRGELTC